VDAQGFPSLTSHSKAKKHRQAAMAAMAAMAAFCDQQVQFALTTSSFSASIKFTKAASQTTIAIRSLTSHADKVTKAEVLFVRKVCTSGYIYNSLRDTADVFKTMLPDSAVARDVTLNPTKLSHVISDGLGLYFHRVLVNDIRNASFFTVEVDATRNVHHQFDIHIRYWSEKEGRIISAYYCSKMLGRATAEIMCHEIVNGLKLDEFQSRRC